MDIEKILETIPKDFYGVNYYDEQEIVAATKVIFNQSPFRYYGNHLLCETEKFEKECAEDFGVNYAHAVNSASGALSCALHALDIKVGDEVIIPGFFWISVANACILNGAIPVLGEVDESLNLDPSDLEKKITEKTKCVVAIHMDGVPADMVKIREICNARNIKIIEDFSQCIGGYIGSSKVGAFGDISVASMQVNKAITAGEGGILLTNNRLYYERIVARADFGYIRDKTTDQVITIGEGRRCNEISAAVLRVQLKKLPQIISDLNNTKKYIMQELGDISPIRYRKSKELSGEVGTSIILEFEKKEDTARFLKFNNASFGNRLQMFLLANFGCHVYYNCSGLVDKVASDGGGFPWKYVESENYSYSKGSLPYTDDILERTVGLKLPGKLNELQKQAIVIALRFIIDNYLRDL